MILVSSRVVTKPGMRDKVVEMARPCIEATRKEAGNVRYDLYASAEDDNTLFYFEEWESVDALRNHSNSPHLSAFREARKDYVQGGSMVRIFEAKEVQLQ